MFHRDVTGRRLRSGIAALALGIGVALSSAHLPAAAAGALVTVPNGITTTDLNAAGMSPTTLAQQLAGAGVTVSNVTFHGAKSQAGLIDVVDPAVVSFNHGVILSSGNVADVLGPNKSDGITGDMGGGADADLTSLIVNTQTVNPTTFDAASLEFDFVPSADRVYFTYTFGSDEYLEWVNLFNDVFAFYVNGTNCATVPSGDQAAGSPISIDTINSTVNPNLFRDNSYSSPPANPINIESDGLSVELICAANVNRNQVNHMKLAIADTSDQILDSVVMIKASSLSVNRPESCNDGIDNDDDAMVDADDDSCAASTTPPPPGGSGIGSGSDDPPFTGNEGTPITLDAAALGWEPTANTVSTSWEVWGINGTDGTCVVEPAGKQPLVAGQIAQATASCPTDGEYTARIDMWDAEGGSDDDKDVDFFVHNAPPTVTIDSPVSGASVSAGQPLTVSASVGDPGADSVDCLLNWGDGTSDTTGANDGTCTATKLYSASGQYVVSVMAKDSAGTGAATAVLVNVVAPFTVPSAPTNPSAVLGATAGSVVVSWGAPVSDGGAALDKYLVKVMSGSTVAKQYEMAASKLTATATGLAAGSYNVTVAAHNVAGWGPAATTSVVVPSVPGAPQSVSAAPGTSGRAVVTWSAPASNGGAAIDTYLAKATPAATNPSGTVGRTCTVAAPATTCTITALAGGDYTVSVQAHNSQGYGPLSAAAAVKVVTLPGVPTGVTATQTAAGKVTGTWIAPASNGGLSIDSYLLRVYNGAGTAVKSCTAVAPSTSCSVTGLAVGSYTVKVQAHNSLGYGTASAAASVTVK